MDIIMAILPTTTLTGEVQTFEGDPIASGSVTFTPTGVDVDAATGAIVAAAAPITVAQVQASLVRAT